MTLRNSNYNPIHLHWIDPISFHRIFSPGHLTSPHLTRANHTTLLRKKAPFQHSAWPIARHGSTFYVSRVVGFCSISDLTKTLNQWFIPKRAITFLKGGHFLRGWSFSETVVVLLFRWRFFLKTDRAWRSLITFSSSDILLNLIYFYLFPLNFMLI